MRVNLPGRHAVALDVDTIGSLTLDASGVTAISRMHLVLIGALDARSGTFTAGAALSVRRPATSRAQAACAPSATMAAPGRPVWQRLAASGSVWPSVHRHPAMSCRRWSSTPT